jgi:hypothetical protein
MNKKSLDDIELMISNDNKIYISQTSSLVDADIISCLNKKDITKDFLKLVMKYFSNSCKNGNIEFKNEVGTFTFKPNK